MRELEQDGWSTIFRSSVLDHRNVYNVLASLMESFCDCLSSFLINKHNNTEKQKKIHYQSQIKPLFFFIKRKHISISCRFLRLRRHRLMRNRKQASQQINRFWMIFDKDLEDRPLEDELPYIEMKNQVSTIFTNGRLTPNPMQFTPFPSFTPCVNEWVHFETSLDRQLYSHNACLLRRAIVAFLKHCLVKQVDEESVFQDGNIFCFEPESSSVSQEGLSECLIEGNSLLTPWRKKRMMVVLQKYGDLVGVFRQLKVLCGRTIIQEIVCIFAEVLQGKLVKMQQLQNDSMDGLLPRMQRFWGDDNDQRIIRGGWNVYNQVDYDSVKRLAAGEVEQLASKLYFSKKLKHLTLASVGGDNISQVNLLDKFTQLVAFLTEGLLLSMEGISQRQQQLQIFVSDLQCTTGKDGEVHVNSSKKIKSDDV